MADLPEHGLDAGATVVILDLYDDGDTYEVEVFDEDGSTLYAGPLGADVLVGEHSDPPEPTTVAQFEVARPAILARIATTTHPTDRSQAVADYINLLPRHPLWRCPLTGEVVERAVDTVELDGPWWDFYDPARPPTPTSPRTVVSWTGALLLHHVPVTPFLAVPGPEVPFVVPALLDIDGVQAVISSLPIGAHQGYPIAYFAPEPGLPASVPRTNDWGASSYLVQGTTGIEEYQDHPYEAEWDYDLAPWIERGKLAWIAPGDDALELRRTVDDCPFIGVTGHRGITRLQDGEAWWPEDVA